MKNALENIQIKKFTVLTFQEKSEFIPEGTQLLKELYLLMNVLTSMEVDLKQKLTF